MYINNFSLGIMSAVEIIPNLWLGNVKASLNKDFIEENGITHIINCTKNVKFAQESLKKVRISLSDTGTEQANTEMINVLDKATTYIYSELLKGHRLLVHCYAGKQRSVAIIVAFIAKYCEWSIQKALDATGNKWPYLPDRYIEALKRWHAGKHLGGATHLSQG